MNSLQQHITTNHLNEIATMNQLQDAVVISDNCVMAADVADGDCERAVRWLRLQGEWLLI